MDRRIKVLVKEANEAKLLRHNHLSAIEGRMDDNCPTCQLMQQAGIRSI